MKIKGILLDIDNTLYDYKKTHRIALGSVRELFRKKYRLYGLKAFDNLYKNARRQVHKKLSKTAASHNRLLYFQRIFEGLNENALKYSLKASNVYWDTFLENLDVYDGVYDFLELIKDKSVCLVSDLTADIQHRKIQKLRLYDYADYVVTSEEVGKEKPHPAIFRNALKKLKLKPSEVLMIGDSYECDIRGALRLGIRSLWLNRDDEVRPPNARVTEFKNFNQLIKILKCENSKIL